jgi:hypothetical protein
MCVCMYVCTYNVCGGVYIYVCVVVEVGGCDLSEFRGRFKAMAQAK